MASENEPFITNSKLIELQKNGQKDKELVELYNKTGK